MTIRNLYPAQRPTIIYNVINGRKQLPVNSTFERQSIGTYVDVTGILKTAEINEARFTHDIVDNVFQGLLLEPTATNYLSYSEDLSRGWTQQFEPEQAVLEERAMTAPDGSDTSWYFETFDTAYVYAAGGDGQGVYTGSCYIKTDGDPQSFVMSFFAMPTTITSNPMVADGQWRRFTFTVTFPSSSMVFYPVIPLEYNQGFYIWGAQLEKNPYATSYIKTEGGAEVRQPDVFALQSVTNFDTGFSLLLDSETLTDDFIYKIKADGTTIAELKNDLGTLDWTINGKSAATNGEYPQVGFLPGRVRTISSFGEAEIGDVTNYLYTTGISFPTTAEPSAGADEIVFGIPQTLKALYVWDGQLNETNAISLIRGKYNFVESKPIDTTRLAFVYNTDPLSKNVVDVSLPDIIPMTSMEVDWGDGNKDTIQKGILPQHTYPYPGLYRIQISAPELFDSILLSSAEKTISRVDSWAPQYQVGANGPGFTGDELNSILRDQYYCKNIPPFKYTDLTNIDYAFYNNQFVDPTSAGGTKEWDFIPTELQECESMRYTFRLLSQANNEGGARARFPQLKTSGKLTNVTQCFDFGPTGFVDEDGNPTLFPWTDTSNVRNWQYCFSNWGGKEIGALNTSSGVGFSSFFQNANQIQKFPAFDFSSAKDLVGAFYNCTALTEVNPGYNFANVTDMRSTWRNCRDVEEFPGNFNLSNVEQLGSCWREMRSLQFFPRYSLPACKTLSEAWYSNDNLTNFPIPTNTNNVQSWNYAYVSITVAGEFPSTLDTSGGTDFYQTWSTCINMTTFPELDFSSVTRLSGAWLNCFKLENFPIFSDAKAPKLNRYVNSTWYGCSSLVAMPVFPYQNIVEAQAAWEECTQLTTFEPNQFDTTGTLEEGSFANSWKNCALTAQSIENILVSLDANGATNIELGIQGGTNADYKDWTSTAKEKYAALVGDKGWDIDINDETNAAPFAMSATSGFYVNHQDGVISFGELTAGSRHASSKANQEVFADEGEAISRVFELNPEFFPRWDRGLSYIPGDRIRFGKRVYRALTLCRAPEFELPTLHVASGKLAEAPTPINRQANWCPVYLPREDGPEEETAAALVAEEVRERRRAHNADGTFRADDPSTPDVNEAWE